MTIDMKDMSGKILWTKGYEAGVEAERERILKLMRELESSSVRVEIELTQIPSPAGIAPESVAIIEIIKR